MNVDPLFSATIMLPCSIQAPIHMLLKCPLVFFEPSETTSHFWGPSATYAMHLAANVDAERQHRSYLLEDRIY